MKSGSCFQEIGPIRQRIAVEFDGSQLLLPAGANLAAALMAEGIFAFSQRGETEEFCSPHCLSGNCGDCMLEINGNNGKSCLVAVRSGLRIRTLNKRAGDGRENV